MDEIQQISQSELEIINIIWQENGRMTLAPLMERLNLKGKTWKTNTIVTFLARLVDKGLLKIDKQGRNNIYTAQVSEQDYLLNQTKAFINKMYANDAKELVASLLRNDYLTAKDVEELTEFWKKGGDAE